MSDTPRRVIKCVQTFLTYENEVLLLLHDKMHTWMGPGGKIMPNVDEPDAPTELTYEAALRELREEAGIVIDWPWSGMPNWQCPRVKELPQIYKCLTYNGYQGFEYHDLLEDHIYWWVVNKDIREQTISSPEGHPCRWFTFAEAFDPALPMHAEVRATLREIFGHNIFRQSRSSFRLLSTPELQPYTEIG